MIETISIVVMTMSVPGNNPSLPEVAGWLEEHFEPPEGIVIHSASIVRDRIVQQLVMNQFLICCDHQPKEYTGIEEDCLLQLTIETERPNSYSYLPWLQVGIKEALGGTLAGQSMMTCFYFIKESNQKKFFVPGMLVYMENEVTEEPIDDDFAYLQSHTDYLDQYIQNGKDTAPDITAKLLLQFDFGESIYWVKF